MTALADVRAVLRRMHFDRDGWFYKLTPRQYTEVLTGLDRVERGEDDTDREDVQGG